ncbi:TPA: DUF927 domain-containing protein [Escherichia coli]
MNKEELIKEGIAEDNQTFNDDYEESDTSLVDHRHVDLSNNKSQSVWFTDGYNTIYSDRITTLNKDSIEYTIHEYPLVPLYVIEAKNANGDIEAYVKIKFVVGGTDENGNVRTRELNITSSELTNYNAYSLHVKAGWQPPTRKYASTVNAILQSAMKHCIYKSGFAKCGWVFNEKLNVWEHITPSNSLYVGTGKNFLEKKGDKKLWLRAFSDLCIDSPMQALMVAVGVCALQRGILNINTVLTYMITLFGRKGRGKSTIINIVNSIASSPIKQGVGGIIDSTATKPALEEMLANRNHFYLCIDEFDDLITRNGGVELAMFLSNGGNRSKMNHRQEVQLGKSWCDIILGAQNGQSSMLASKHTKKDAVLSRIIELDIEDPDITTYRDIKALRENESIIQKNYGHGYEMLVDTISKNRDDYDLEFKRAYDSFVNDKNLSYMIGSEDRLVDFLSMLTVSCIILGDTFGEEVGQSATDALNVFISRQKRDISEYNKEHEKAVAVINKLKQNIAFNSSKFIWEGFAYTEVREDLIPRDIAQKQAEQAKEYTRSAIEKGAMGIIYQDTVQDNIHDFNGEVLIDPNGGENGEKIDFGKGNTMAVREIIEAAKLLGLIHKEKNGKLKNGEVKYKDRPFKAKAKKERKYLPSNTDSLRIILRPFTEDDMYDEEQKQIMHEASVKESKLEGTLAALAAIADTRKPDSDIFDDDNFVPF